MPSDLDFPIFYFFLLQWGILTKQKDDVYSQKKGFLELLAGCELLWFLAVLYRGAVWRDDLAPKVGAINFRSFGDRFTFWCTPSSTS